MLKKVSNQIHFFVCKHGFGHLKRVASVVSELIAFTEVCSIIIHCHQNTFEKANEWFGINELSENPKVEFSFDIMSKSPIYDSETSSKSIDDWLLSVKDKINNIKGFAVIDNDASLLYFFPKAIMMGSFLWADILSEDNYSVANKELADRERRLIERLRPPMLCIEDIAMPSVKEWTNSVGLPWFCESYQQRVKEIQEREGVLLTGGGTKKQLANLLILAEDLSNLNLSVYVDSGIYYHSGNKYKLFSYKDEDFAKLRMVICRPGIGILSDCIRFGVPIMALEEVANKEMQHNVEVIENLQIGKRITLDSQKEEIRNLYYSKELVKWHKNILNRPTGGVLKAAQWIIKNMKEEYEN